MALQQFGPLLILIGLISGCVAPNVKPAYPALATGTPESVLKIDNTLDDPSEAGLHLIVRFALELTIDGFSPLDPAKLKGRG